MTLAALTSVSERGELVLLAVRRQQRARSQVAFLRRVDARATRFKTRYNAACAECLISLKSGSSGQDATSRPSHASQNALPLESNFEESALPLLVSCFVIEIRCSCNATKEKHQSYRHVLPS